MKNIENLFYEREIDWLKKQLKQTKIGFYFIFVMFLLVAFMFWIHLDNESSISFIKKSFNTFNKTINITFNNLSNQEIKEIDNLIKDFKPEYLNLARFIVFTNNRTLMIDDENSSAILLGFNYNNGDVYVFYDRNFYENKYWQIDFNDAVKFVLCHELIHSGFNNRNFDEEWFVSDISDYGVCYE